MKKILISVIIFFVCVTGMLSGTISVFAEEEDGAKTSDIPQSVMSIAKENTYPNPAQDLPRLQPSTLTEQLFESTEVTIENPELIKMLNESTIKGSKLALGMNVSIYLGQWPLSYESDDTVLNWDYEKINTNMVDNRGGQDQKKIQYSQQQQKRIKGGLTAEIKDSEMVKNMMRLKAEEKTKMPLSFSTIIGFGTQTERVYNVAPQTMGYLDTYASAVNEKGKVTYGEVYLKIKGDKPSLEIKNVTQQGIGAWIPIQDYVNLRLESAKAPRS
ncbi:YfkD family protein [Salipaludibacillus aurantiacus]|uniref:YfkD-like protein n=1 Tax=Salipaludibacillus aurantiacus TaxID=1601833 RepID=A0A1H9SJA9_9BACI|nr:YfkD-like protein [Salipaludibacillus aurantiacus]